MIETGQPAKCGPLTFQSARLPSEVRTKAPLRVPTDDGPALIFSFLFSPLGAQLNCWSVEGEKLARASAQQPRFFLGGEIWHRLDQLAGMRFA